MYLLSHKLYKKKSLFLAKNELFLLGKYKTRDNFQNLQNIINNPNGYAKGIANGLKDYLTEIKNI